MREITEIIIHHSASDFGNAKLIDKWHKEFGWDGIGYHFVVLNGFQTNQDFVDRRLEHTALGKIEKGRDIEKVGSHAKGRNKKSIGVCLIHNKLAYNQAQLSKYRNLVATLAVMYKIPVTNIIGHYEIDKGKPLCPSLNMEVERELIKNEMKYIMDRDINFIKQIMGGK